MQQHYVPRLASQQHGAMSGRRGNAATPWTNTEIWTIHVGMEQDDCQDDAFWLITRSYERSCWELEQNKNKLLFWPLRRRILRIACGYLLHSSIFLYSLCRIKDFGIQINSTISTEKHIFLKWVLFPIWPSVTVWHLFEYVHSPINLCVVLNECNLNEISCAPCEYGASTNAQ